MSDKTPKSPTRTKLHDIYRPSLSLLTDLYQVSMAYAYFKSGRHLHEAMFQLYFRKNPFNGGFAVACGLETAAEYIADFKWTDDDLEYLATLTGSDDKPLVDGEFLEYLRKTPLSVSVDAVEEGRVVFGQEPLVRVRGPLLQCQLLETPLLNLINFPTLIATKAARVCLAAGDDPVLEFGLRRAQGIDGGLTAARAAYVGGVAATSNLMAGRLFGIPVRGTHAHSWVMSFDDELESFLAFAKAMPGNSVFLVDTYNTLEGVENAIKAGQRMKTHGHKMIGIRLDSGDLAYLSRVARTRLDDAGFRDAVIVASNDLDEHLISSLKAQGSPIGVWGVGTKLVTGYDDPALGGVYKMVAIRENSKSPWHHKMKLSDQLSKITTPGQQQVRRFSEKGQFMGDMIFDELAPPTSKSWTIVDPLDMTSCRAIPASAEYEDLLVPVFESGKLVYPMKGLNAARERCKSDLAKFHEGIKRQTNPHTYPVGLETSLHEHKAKMILERRGFEGGGE